MRRMAVVLGGLAIVIAAGVLAAVLLLREDDSERFLSTPEAQPLTEAVDRGLLIVRDQQLLVRDMAGGVEYKIKERPTADSYYAYPRWRPDGGRIAYVIAAQVSAAGRDWGSDVAVSDADGGNEQIVFTHEKQGTTIEGIDWTPDGRALYLSIIEPEIRDGRFLGSTMRLQRLDLAGGERTTIVEAAAYPTVSPDGNRIAYVTYSGGERPAGLWTARPDGSDARLIVPLGDVIAGFRAPRFSPDGTTLAFGAVDAAEANQMATMCDTGRRWPWQPRIAAAHGSPVDIWTVGADGSGLRKVADLSEDDPSVAWAPDGARLAVVGACGLYLVSLADGNAGKVAAGALLSQMDWR